MSSKYLLYNTCLNSWGQLDCQLVSWRQRNKLGKVGPEAKCTLSPNGTDVTETKRRWEIEFMHSYLAVHTGPEQNETDAPEPNGHDAVFFEIHFFLMSVASGRWRMRRTTENVVSESVVKELEVHYRKSKLIVELYCKICLFQVASSAFSLMVSNNYFRDSVR